MSKLFSRNEVAAHKKSDDLWIVVDEDVYDLTKFQSEHPGNSPGITSIEPEWQANEKQVAKRVRNHKHQNQTRPDQTRSDCMRDRLT